MTAKIEGFIERPRYLGPKFYGWLEDGPVVGTHIGWDGSGVPLVETSRGLERVPDALSVTGDDQERVTRLLAVRAVASEVTR